MLFVYALHFFLLTQAALIPPAHFSCVVRAATGLPHGGTGAARGLGSWSGEAAEEGARQGLLRQSLAARRSASAEAAAADGDGLACLPSSAAVLLPGQRPKHPDGRRQLRARAAGAR